MNAPPSKLSILRAAMLAFGLLAAALTLSACAPGGGQAGMEDDADGCGSAADCEEPARLSAEVRLDADAMLAGIAHARARLGLQEDATP
jgi:hypothetical protein